MGFTALDGLPMGTRPGQLDAGVVLYLMSEKGMSAKEIERLLYFDCGLKGFPASATTCASLLASADPRAKLALDYFTYRIALLTGMLAAAMGGIDGFVFTAGIGENAPSIREAVAQRLAWLGLELSSQANGKNELKISRKRSRVGCYVIPTDEELMIAEHALDALRAHDTAAARGETSMIDLASLAVLKGKKALVTGIANDQSIAWGCAKAFHAFGADLAITYRNEKTKRYVDPLAKQVDASIYLPLDVQKPGELDSVFEAIKKKWGKLDIMLHSIAFAPKDDLQGRVVDCSKDGFLLAMELSCWSFLGMAKRAEPLMKDGGTLFTMTYYGSQMVVENYNIMGPVKAALEAATRYMAAELGPKGIRVHAISPGPLKTRAASGLSDFDKLLQKAQAKAPSRSLVSIDDVGVAVAFLAMNGAKLITGETLYIDGGYHIID